MPSIPIKAGFPSRGNRLGPIRIRSGFQPGYFLRRAGAVDYVDDVADVFVGVGMLFGRTLSVAAAGDNALPALTDYTDSPASRHFRQFVACSTRSRDQLVGLVVIDEAFGLGIPL